MARERDLRAALGMSAARQLADRRRSRMHVNPCTRLIEYVLTGFRVLGSRWCSSFLVRSRFPGIQWFRFLGFEFQVRRRLDWSGGDIRSQALGTRNP